MKESFEELVKTVKQSVEKCPWHSRQTLEDCKEELQSELKELFEAIDKKDFKNLKEELGDLFYDVLATMFIAQKAGILDPKDVIESVNAKINRRKPWLFDENSNVDAKEASRIWHDVKAKEKSKIEVKR